MEGVLPLGGWIVVIVMGVAGAWMFFVLRPVSPWWKAIGSLAPAVAGGVAVSLSLCEYFALDSLHYKMLGSFGASLICMPASSLAVRIVESIKASDAAVWLKDALLRFLGVSKNGNGRRLSPAEEHDTIKEDDPKE